MNAVEFPACQFTLQIKAAGACPIWSSANTVKARGTIFISIALILIAFYVLI
jgi:hypothetical protein